MGDDPVTRGTASRHAPRTEIDVVRSATALIFDRWFGTLFWGKLLGGVGVWIHSIVAALVVYGATGSALWVGLTSVVQFAPHIVLTPLSGKWADRGHLLRQMIYGRFLSVAGSGGAAVLCLLNGTPSDAADAVGILVATSVAGLGFVLGGPAQQSIIPSLIREGELPVAMALNTLPMTLARVMGPAFGAVVVTQVSAGAAFAVAAAAHVLFVTMLIAARLPEGVWPARGTDQSIRSALRFVRGHRSIRLWLLVVTGVGFGSEPAITLAPVIAESTGGGPALVGQLTSAFGLGAAAGFFVYRALRRRLSESGTLRAGLATMVAGTLLLATAHNPPLSLAAFLLVGLGFTPTLTAATSLIQQTVPGGLRGRVMALWMVGFIGSRPAAAGIDGFLADVASFRVALLVTAAVLLALLINTRPRAAPARQIATEHQEQHT